MKTYTAKLSHTVRKNLHEYMARRQAANYERLIQGKADVFQLAEIKDQAIFWAMN